jgi:hypothetical protein
MKHYIATLVFSPYLDVAIMERAEHLSYMVSAPLERVEDETAEAARVTEAYSGMTILPQEWKLCGTIKTPAEIIKVFWAKAHAEFVHVRNQYVERGLHRVKLQDLMLYAAQQASEIDPNLIALIGMALASKSGAEPGTLVYEQSLAGLPG